MTPRFRIPPALLLLVCAAPGRAEAGKVCHAAKIEPSFYRSFDVPGGEYTPRVPAEVCVKLEGERAVGLSLKSDTFDWSWLPAKLLADKYGATLRRDGLLSDGADLPFDGAGAAAAQYYALRETGGRSMTCYFIDRARSDRYQSLCVEERGKVPFMLHSASPAGSVFVTAAELRAAGYQLAQNGLLASSRKDAAPGLFLTEPAGFQAVAAIARRLAAERDARPTAALSSAVNGVLALAKTFKSAAAADALLRAGVRP